MTLELQQVKGIGKKIAERMKGKGIDSITKLASTSVEDLSKIRGIGNSMAKTYIHIAQNYLKNTKVGNKEKNIDQKKLNEPDPIDPMLNTPIRELDGKLEGSHSYYSQQTMQIQNQGHQNEIEKNKPQDGTLSYMINKSLTPSQINEKNSDHLISREFLDVQNRSNTKETLDPSNSKNQNKSSIMTYISLKNAKKDVTHIENKKSKKEKNYEKIKKSSSMNHAASNKKSLKRNHKVNKRNKKKTRKTQSMRERDKVNYSNSNKSQIAVLETKASKPDSKIKEKEVSVYYSKKIFDLETVQRIRFLHLKIKKIEKEIFRGEVGHSILDLELFHEYITLLNVNYKTKNQNLILRELDLTLSYYDPIDRVDINIYDIMFECARTLWVMALFCSNLSEKYESEGNWENAIVTMIECSKSYKAASYFSGAAVNQRNIGSSLNPEYLEFKSEETRILAQSIASLKEESTNNFFLASKLYAGLSAMSKRLYYLKPHDEKTRMKIQAQFSYDIGKSCHLKAKAIGDLSKIKVKNRQFNEKINLKLLKANYYYSIAEGLWEALLQNFKDLTKKEKKDIEDNLKIVNENIMENDVEILDYEGVKHIQDPEPIIIVPENLSEHIPKVVNYLRRYSYRDHSVKRLKRFRSIKFEEKIAINKKSELLNKKATLGRLVKEIKYLYDNNDIDIDKYMELLEKYKSKIYNLNTAIELLNKR
jgi:hypothetical protein